MSKSPAINRNTDFRRAYHRGKSTAHPVLVTYALKNCQGLTRTGITTSKKIGKAVERNRARRVIREAYRQLLPEVSPGWDLVFVARTRTVFSKTPRIKEVMRQQLATLGIIKCGKSQ